jgi:hypothetical protein
MSPLFTLTIRPSLVLIVSLGLDTLQHSFGLSSTKMLQSVLSATLLLLVSCEKACVEKVMPIKAMIVFIDINSFKNFINNCSFIIKTNANVDFFFI